VPGCGSIVVRASSDFRPPSARLPLWQKCMHAAASRMMYTTYNTHSLFGCQHTNTLQLGLLPLSHFSVGPTVMGPIRQWYNGRSRTAEEPLPSSDEILCGSAFCRWVTSPWALRWWGPYASGTTAEAERQRNRFLVATTSFAIWPFAVESLLCGPYGDGTHTPVVQRQKPNGRGTTSLIVFTHHRDGV
jgi:hypothetical protein